MDTYDEESVAEIKDCLIWCEGRFEDLRKAGLAEGRSSLTAKGREKYKDLVATAFKPDMEKVVKALQFLNVEADAIVPMARLMVNNHARAHRPVRGGIAD